MAVPILMQMVLRNVNGVPEDSFITDWAFLAADTDTATLDGINLSIQSWFKDANTTLKIQQYLSPAVESADSAHECRAYDLTGHLDGSPHGSPIYTSAWTTPTPGATGLPNEVALVQSLWADGYNTVPVTEANPTPPPATIRPRSRYRGRIYLGPLATIGLGGVSSGDARPTTNFAADLQVAWARFMDERGDDFCVWSRVDEEMRTVAPAGKITIDNAFDTQRRRGAARTAVAVAWP